MYNDLEEIYIMNNMSGKKHKKWILPLIILLAIAMLIALIKRNVFVAFIVMLTIVVVVFILKIVIYFTATRPKKILEYIKAKEQYTNIVYCKTKQDITSYLKNKELLNKATLNTIMDYYKDLKHKNKFDVEKVSNWLLTVLSSIGVVTSLYSEETLIVLSSIIFITLIAILIAYIENKFLEKLFEGILDNRINYKDIYRMINEIYIDVINNKIKSKEVMKIRKTKIKEKIQNERVK